MRSTSSTSSLVEPACVRHERLGVVAKSADAITNCLAGQAPMAQVHKAGTARVSWQPVEGDGGPPVTYALLWNAKRDPARTGQTSLTLRKVKKGTYRAAVAASNAQGTSTGRYYTDARGGHQPEPLSYRSHRLCRVQSLTSVPTFSRIRVHDFGSVEEVVFVPPVLDDIVTVWTACETARNPLATVEIRGVLTAGHELAYLPEDAKVTVIEGPQFAGMPEDLIKEATPVAPPEGSLGGGMVTPEGWPPLIWDNDPLFSPCQGWSDPETSVEVILCALSVAPPSDPELIPFLLAALKARYATVKKDPRTYPPARYPWRDGRGPNKSLLDYLRG